MSWKVAELAMEEEVLIRPLENVVVLMPPIEISKEDLQKQFGLLTTQLRRRRRRVNGSAH